MLLSASSFVSSCWLSPCSYFLGPFFAAIHDLVKGTTPDCEKATVSPLFARKRRRMCQCHSWVMESWEKLQWADARLCCRKASQAALPAALLVDGKYPTHLWKASTLVSLLCQLLRIRTPELVSFFLVFFTLRGVLPCYFPSLTGVCLAINKLSRGTVDFLLGFPIICTIRLFRFLEIAVCLLIHPAVLCGWKHVNQSSTGLHVGVSMLFQVNFKDHCNSLYFIKNNCFRI